MGNPLGFILTPGQAHDLQGADALLPDMTAETLLADKAFDADERVIEPLLARGKSFVIPPKKPGWRMEVLHSPLATQSRLGYVTSDDGKSFALRRVA